MASLKAIRRRIASVKTTQQITRAMKLVAASRLRRAQDALSAARPYSQALARVADSLLTSEGINIAPPEGARKAALIAVIASDRGLCGGYNSNLLRAAEESLRVAEREGLAAGYFAVGKKAVDHFRRTKAPMSAQSQDNLPKLATITLARKIAARMLSDYQSGEITEAAIVYTQFKSAIALRPVYERLLPVAKPENKDPNAQPIDYLVEPSRAELVPVVLRSYLEAAVFNALLQAEASEQAARMTAMESATNNAIDMIASYTLEMNRARQAQITRELMDIVGGAEALRG
ncbi:MAG: ATP synthase F1 subunit gamma [Candidatus Binataceae bacterium]|jgi:F-type H+-transporting ATPase subunit gamma